MHHLWLFRTNPVLLYQLRKEEHYRSPGPSHVKFYSEDQNFFSGVLNHHTLFLRTDNPQKF